MAGVRLIAGLPEGMQKRLDPVCGGPGDGIAAQTGRLGSNIKGCVVEAIHGAAWLLLSDHRDREAMRIPGKFSDWQKGPSRTKQKCNIIEWVTVR